VGDIVLAYPSDTGIAAVGGFIKPRPKTSMAFRIVSMDDSMAQIMIEPVAIATDAGRRGEEALSAPAEAWVAVGPKALVRICMTDYRWSLTFGDLILNWEDFLAPVESAG
jgi:hypothetical protein